MMRPESPLVPAHDEWFAENPVAQERRPRTLMEVFADMDRRLELEDQEIPGQLRLF